MSYGHICDFDGCCLAAVFRVEEQDAYNTISAHPSFDACGWVHAEAVRNQHVAQRADARAERDAKKSTPLSRRTRKKDCCK